MKLFLGNIYIKNVVQALILLFALSGCFVVDHNLMRGVISAKWFWFYGISCLLMIMLVAELLFGKNTVRFSLFDVGVGGAAILLLFSAYKSYGSIAHNEFTLKVVAGLINWFAFRYIITRLKRQITLVIVLYLVVVLFVAIHGLLQLYGILPSNHSGFLITGSFHNPGPFSGFVMSGLPMALGLFLATRKKYRIEQKDSAFGLKECLSFHLKIPARNTVYYYFSQLVVIVLFLVLSATQSRAAWLGGVAGNLYVLWCFRDKLTNSQRSGSFLFAFVQRIFSLRKKVLVLTGLLFILIFSVSLYKFKQGSADGRLLMWQVSWEMIKDKPVFGWGVGGFDANYSNYQAEWFRSEKGTPAQEMVAGAPDAPFNEIIRIGISHGLVGVVLLLAACILLFKKSGVDYLNGKSVFFSKGIVLLKGALLSILCFSLFSYTFDISPMVLQLIILSALIVSIQKEQGDVVSVRIPGRFRVILLRFVGIVLLVLLPVLGSTSLQRYQAYKHWKEAYQLYQFQIYSDAAEEYLKATEFLPNSGLLLQMYGKCLLMNAQYQESKKILEKARQYRSDPILYTALGDTYKALSKYTDAEQAYLQAWYMIPHKFYPKYLLAKLYDESGQKEKAKQIAKELLDKEVKVESKAIEEMKDELKNIIN